MPRTGAWAKPLLKASSSSESPQIQKSEVKNNDESSDFSSEDDDEHKDHVVEKLQAAVFLDYPSAAHGEIFEAGLSRVSSLLVATKGGQCCLVCLERVRKDDPTWHCYHGCFAIMHLVCIQSWSRQSLATAKYPRVAVVEPHGTVDDQRGTVDDLRGTVNHGKPLWHCPKCRAEYPETEIPREYLCFCRKQLDPEPDPWLTPHSCGERCERRLGNCGHTCMLLCHPGPCPPCPQLVDAGCYCGKTREPRRCGTGFSCNQACRLKLGCGIHACEEKCHPGKCEPCSKAGVHRCKCGLVSEVRPCSESEFQCENVCENELGCGRHRCGRRCHLGPCGECEFQGKQTCPCGHRAYPELDCDAKAPTCGLSCGKLLDCGYHRCPDRCHYGPCASTCRIIMRKTCRCGGLKKEVPCCQDLVCEKRCQNTRNCTRHACKRRCCNGDCPPCSEVCGKKLRCGNHKCPAPCHRGLCAPCPLTVKIPCACGYRCLEVPCGAEKGIRPPKCSKRCNVEPLCVHGSKCKPHRCHYGACPPCELDCNVELSCGHLCEAKCHGPQPQPKPEYGASKKKSKRPILPTEGTPCPPCPELVYKDCMGRHREGVMQVVCSDPRLFSCGNPCGNPLACGNHFCEKPCHIITVPRILPADETSEPFSHSESEDVNEVDSCSTCSLQCQKKRVPPCAHPCEKKCHPGPCESCSVHLKRNCHCGTLAKFFECSKFNSLSPLEQSQLLSCGGPCHRKLPSCSHFCSEICHPGACPDVCLKKVVVRCKCQRLKKEWPCSQVRGKSPSKSAIVASRGASFVGLLECDEECLKIEALKQQQRLQMEQDVQKRKNASVPEIPEPQKKPKIRKSRSSRGVDERSRTQELLGIAWKWMAVFSIVVVVVVGFYFGIRGLLKLSDWMNQRDAARRTQKRLT